MLMGVQWCAAWDYSAWVRTYALFLEERLECFRVLKYDVESERATVSDLHQFLWALCLPCACIKMNLTRSQVFILFIKLGDFRINQCSETF